MAAAELPLTLPAAASANEAGAKTRLYFADHLRAALVALVLIHHLTISLAIALPGLWYFEVPNDSRPALVVGLLLLLIDQSFFMGAFFLIAGYFTPPSYDRKGAGAFLRDRVIRLIIPLGVFWLVLNPVTLALGAVGSHQPVSTGWDAYLSSIGPGPLWFVEVLFLLSAGYVGLRLLLRRRVPERAPERYAPPTLRLAVLFTLGLAAATFVFRLAVPVGYILPYLELPTPSYLPQYVGLFAVGVIAARRGWFHSMPDRMGWIGFAASGLVTVTVFLPSLVSGAATGTFAGGLHWQAAGYALWDSTMAVGMFCGLLMVFRRWTNHAGRLWNELSRNAFGVYVLHPPLLVLVALPIALAPIAPLLKLLAAVVVAIPFCFMVAGLVRRVPGVGRVL
ncbi:MAG: acyltransferase family protein [Candidatus Dormibacteraeota bacterium]|nr:acyltransferase family protein [Candidatus Dormibacteraeota bacterium]